MVPQVYKLAEGWIFDAELQTSWSSWRSIGCKDKRRGKLGEKESIYSLFLSCMQFSTSNGCRALSECVQGIVGVRPGHCRIALVGIVRLRRRALPGCGGGLCQGAAVRIVG